MTFKSLWKLAFIKSSKERKHVTTFDDTSAFCSKHGTEATSYRRRSCRFGRTTNRSARSVEQRECLIRLLRNKQRNLIYNSDLVPHKPLDGLLGDFHTSLARDLSYSRVGNHLIYQHPFVGFFREQVYSWTYVYHDIA